MENIKKRTIVLVAKALGSMAFLAVFILNLILFVQKDDQTGKVLLTSLSAYAQGESGGTSAGACNWPYWSCNQRRESVEIICDATTWVSYTWYDFDYNVVGTGIWQGGILKIETGYSTSHYTYTTGGAGSYLGTRVMCPTDGNTNDCEEYHPCPPENNS